MIPHNRNINACHGCRSTVQCSPLKVQVAKCIGGPPKKTNKIQNTGKTIITKTISPPRFPEAPFPDILHSYFSICGLSLCGLLPPLDAMLGMSLAARRRAEARGLLPATTTTAGTTATTEAEGTPWRRWVLLAVLVLAISGWLAQ